MIDRPGIYANVSAADYHSDPLPRPSLTQSVAKILLDKSPLHAWHAHPRLNPDYRHDDATKFDIGNVAHSLILGRGREVVILEFEDWRKKAAQETRATAIAQGKLPVLEKHYRRAMSMVTAAREQLDMRGLGDVFRVGDAEVVTAWTEGECWFRQMVDYLSPGNLIFQDFKTTGESAAPHALARKMASDGWAIQAAFAERGLDVLDPKSVGRRRYLFVVQEDYSPYCLSVVELSESVMTMGRKQVQHAVQMWTDCLQQNRWPGYPPEVVVPDYPGWAETQWLEREQDSLPTADDVKGILRNNDLIMAG